MPVNEWNQILFIITFSVPPIRSKCADPLQFCVSSALEGSISLTIELPLRGLNSGLPALRIFYSTRTVRKVKGVQRQFHYLDDEIR